MTITFQSRELCRKVTFSAIIPTTTKSLYDPVDKKEESKGPLRTLYLLHGWDGNHEDWVQNTRIVELATKHHIAVILPSGENSFYVDHPNANNYGKFLVEELIQETRSLFHLSEKREDTWIAGLSMGGYGALRNGLLHQETFGKIAAFSSRILTKNDKYHELEEENPINKRLQAIIGGESYQFLPKEMDIYELSRETSIFSDLYLACGTEDFLYEENRAYHHYLLEKEIKHIYKEAPGRHDWNFWNQVIVEALEWMTQ
jgi:S-formylglutathione hydrolase FrmB